MQSKNLLPTLETKAFDYYYLNIYLKNNKYLIAKFVRNYDAYFRNPNYTLLYTFIWNSKKRCFEEYGQYMDNIFNHLNKSDNKISKIINFIIKS